MKSKRVGYIKTYSILWPIILALLSLIIIGLQIDLLRRDSEPRVYYHHFGHKQALQGHLGGQNRLARVTCYRPTGNLTASSKIPRYGMVATSDRSIPFGTIVYIEGEKFSVEDRTARWVHIKKGNTIDIFKEDCTKEFGATIKQVIY